MGTVPDAWKTAILVRLPKSPLNPVSYYRPVMLTSSFCNVLETIPRKSILSHLILSNVFSDNQRGFLKWKSALTQILTFCCDRYEGLNNDLQANVVYINLAQTFHSVAVLKLAEFEGLWNRWHCPAWLKNFLCGRSFGMNVRSALSSLPSVLGELPQYSILWPLLSPLFVDELFNWCKLYVGAVNRPTIQPQFDYSGHVKASFHQKTSHSNGG